jgi:putrescine transport system permease protein
MMNTNFAVVLVMVYSYLPFMILPLYANLEKLDPRWTRRRWTLARALAGVLDVTLPQSMPGIIAGGLLVFIPAAGELVIPTLVGNAVAAR